MPGRKAGQHFPAVLPTLDRTSTRKDTTCSGIVLEGKRTDSEEDLERETGIEPATSSLGS